jgi:dienelactone hydrolase
MSGALGCGLYTDSYFTKFVGRNSTMREYLILVLIAVSSTLLIAGQPPQPQLPGDGSIRSYLASRAAELEAEFFPNLKPEDWATMRPALYKEYMAMLGLDPLPEKTPLKATITGKLEKDNYTVEKIHFQSRPGLYVTANLYLPKPLNGKYPTILYQCGHGNQQRNGNKTHYEDHGIWYATHGYVCLVTDTLQLGEIGAIHHGTYREQRWWWHSAGYTSAGVECWNAIRALDYLETRPEVDTTRIGATGISGGGAATFWISAADERIKVTAPTSGMADLQYYVGEDGVNGHCDCMFLYNRARWNWTTIAALICPRPLMFVNSDADIIFPMDANERVINRLERLYSRFGVSDKVDAMVSVGGHAYRTDLRRATYEFFNRHFKNDTRPVTDPDSAQGESKDKPQIPREQLRVFPTDADIPADQINTRIDQEFVVLAKFVTPEKDKLDDWRKNLIAKLKHASFNAWPATAPDTLNMSLGDQPLAGKEFTENNLEVHWQWLPGKDKSARWLVILNNGEELSKLPDWARDVVKENSALLLAPRGCGPGAWTRKNPPNTIERSFVLLGATVDSGRIWDALTVVRRRLEGGAPWQIAGKGEAGILAAYAALFETRIAGVVAVDPPPSHRPKTEGASYGPALLNVLRVTDIPEVLGALAPRPLKLVNAKAADFEITTQLYGLAGAADKLQK